tara:strand:- start:886 stop:1320 length:435 start_codon:yes stop_codon:yes gene_type:complete
MKITPTRLKELIKEEITAHLVEDGERLMAPDQLQGLRWEAKAIQYFLEWKDEEEVPEWVESKITKAADYISTVWNYLLGGVDPEGLPMISLDEENAPDYQIRHLRRLIGDADGDGSVWIKTGGEVKNIREIYVGKSGNLIIEVD